MSRVVAVFVRGPKMWGGAPYASAAAFCKLSLCEELHRDREGVWWDG